MVHGVRALCWLIAAAFATSMMGCDAGSTVEPQVINYSFQPQGFEGLTLQVQQGDKVWHFAAEDFRRTGSNQTPHAGPIAIRDNAPFAVAAEFQRGDDTIASGDVSISGKDDFRWFVAVYLGDQDPTVGCFHCTGSKRFEIPAEKRRSPGEAFWITWGGSREGDELF